MPFRWRAFVVWTFAEIIAVLAILWKQGVLG